MTRRGTRVRLPAEALDELARADAAMGRLIETVGPFGLRKGRSRDDLEALARAIVYQQLSGKAAATIFGRLVALYEPSEGFPSAEAILATHPLRLRKVGLSRQKEAALRDLCRRAHSGELALGRTLRRRSDEAVIETLSAVRGIGRWSAQMFLMFHLGRLDVWPTGDLGVRKGLARLRGVSELPSPRDMIELGERYRPWRSVASWYLWRLLDGEAQL